MNFVYLVEQGEDSEGGRVLAAFDSQEKAHKHAIEYIGDNSMEWVGNGVDYWRSGCDWLRVRKERVL